MTHRIYPPGSARPALACVVSGCLLLSSIQGCASTPPPAEAQPIVTAVSQPLATSSQEIDQLVAPIALYPDPLVAQVLAAATYPTEIVEADRWMQEHSTLEADALAKAVDPQSWDPSVKALTQFPTVLTLMDQNLTWTSALGEAYGGNPATVMEAVQRMRHKAQQAGNLTSSPQEVVTTQDQTISIEPPSADIVYVPEYDPWLVYGDPIAFYPGWVGVPGLFWDGPGLYFGVGIGVGLFGGYGWGWHHWDADWHHHFVGLDHHPFISRSPTFGHFRPTGRPGGFGHPNALPRMGGFSAGAMHSSAFSGFNHGGVAHTFSSRGAASFGGMHGGFHGGFHGGGHR
jgi:hypothetical protein